MLCLTALLRSLSASVTVVGSCGLNGAIGWASRCVGTCSDGGKGKGGAAGLGGIGFSALRWKKSTLAGELFFLSSTLGVAFCVLIFESEFKRFLENGILLSSRVCNKKNK